ncbi:hypothetical protein N1851_021637 [Merluccius polli]|uniref:Uncharacterized protein n=1 Tax=Merluccius polli TaxID=89951 RepID=A0AA47MJ68_MERPO|nr:hypothetical protein N1851_021637 [Merluccius polli]
MAAALISQLQQAASVYEASTFYYVYAPATRNSMSLYLSLWMRVGSLSLVLVAVGTMECTEQESLITIVVPTQCLMDCNSLTFTKKLQLGDTRNIRLTDSTEEEHRNSVLLMSMYPSKDLKEYCWPVDLKCNVGERLQRAFVVVPVDPSVVAHEHLAVKSTGPVVGTLSAHGGPATLADDCGIRYEVTPIYQSTSESMGKGLSFCIQVVALQPLSRDGMLKCPPFLVTIWQPSAAQPMREGGG